MALVVDEGNWLAEADIDGAAEALGLKLLAEEDPESPEKNTRYAVTGVKINKTSKANRRRQYVAEGCEPTGCNIARHGISRPICNHRLVMSETSTIASVVTQWFRREARDLPWRRPETTPWQILVSEIMLQQTPVERVREPYAQWLARWPDASSLAAASPGDVVRQWGKLGYPRRALRLQQCAVALVERFNGEVPDDVYALLSLPGIGDYTARAVATFAFGQRHPVVDTNVRRVVARAVEGAGDAGPPSARRDLAATEALLPESVAEAALCSAALMELGAVICTARSPRCDDCPIKSLCAWQVAGRPPYEGPRRKPQGYAGTDRQVRGLLLDVLRNSHGPVDATAMDVQWHDKDQRARALSTLLSDGLVHRLPDGRFSLPL